MVDSLSISLSGMQAQIQRVAGSASNIANLRSTGALEPGPGDRAAFQPVETAQRPVTGPNGQGMGTRAYFRPSNPAVRAELQPEDPAADRAGLVAAPNVSIERETIRQAQGVRTFQANFLGLRAADELRREALNIKA